MLAAHDLGGDDIDHESLITCLVVTAVVWSISMLRSLPLRALIYSLPLPITIVLVTADISVDGAQLAGVVLLVVFFAVVSWLHHTVHLPILLADTGGVVAYIVLAVGVTAFSSLPFMPMLLLVSALWAVTNGAIWRWMRRNRTAARTTAGQTQSAGYQNPLGKLLIVFAGSVIAISLGGLLNGLVVTFPYSGVLVAIESRKLLPSFTRLFAMNSAGLIGFMSGYYLMSDHGKPAALLTAWIIFGAVGTLVHMPRILRTAPVLAGRARTARPVVRTIRCRTRLRRRRDRVGR